MNSRSGKLKTGKLFRPENVDKGQSMIGLLFMMPLMLMVMMLLIEVWNFMVSTNHVSHVSRELAARAYRECRVEPKEDVSNCFQAAVLEAYQNGVNLLKDFDLNGTTISTFYRYRHVNGQAAHDVKQIASHAAGGRHRSNFSSARHLDYAFMKDHNSVVISEVFYELSAITPLGRLLESNLGLPDVIYEVAIN